MASGQLILPYAEPALSDAGGPISGATLTVYIAGSSTLASLFADAALGTPITNPQISDSAGRFFKQSTDIWVDSSQAYDAVLFYPSTGQTFTFLQNYALGAGVDISGLAPINSPNFTGVPTAPTPALNDNSNKIATTGFVKGQNYAPLNSPAFTGVPTAPTAAAGNNTTQLATTAFVTGALGATLPTSITSGFLKIGGIYIQWAQYSLGAAPAAQVTVSWPTAFPTAVISSPWVVVNGASPGTGAAIEMIGVNTWTTTSVNVIKGNGDNFARTGTVYGLGY